MNNKRPKYLNVFRIRLPWPALVSILHRISGLMLFLALPALLWMLQQSLASPESYTQVGSVLSHPMSKLLLLLILWALLHHLCAGIRFLAIDLDIGAALAPARAGAKAVLAASLLLTALIGAYLW